MKKLLKYALLQFKRVARYIPFVLLITVVLCLCLSLALYTLVDIDNSDESNKKLRLGIVGEFYDSYFDFGVSAIQSLDSSRFSIDIVQMDEEQAIRELRNGEITGYVIIPNEFIIDAYSGEVGHLTFVTNENGIDMVTLFKQDVLDLISCMLVESQNGVYSMEDIVVEYQLDNGDLFDHITVLSTEYVSLIFNRSNAIESETIGVSDNLSLSAYMFSGITVLLMLLCGITCCPLFVRHDMAMPKLMNANRYYPPLQILGEYSAFFAVMLINTAVLFGLMLLGAGKILGIVPEISELTYSDMAIMLLKLLPAVLAITALQFLLYELSDSVVSGVLLQFITAIGLAYVSGCLYPISFFPESIRAISAITPSGIARGYLSSLISGDGSTAQLISLVCYALILLAITVLVRRRRIKIS